MNSSIIGGRYCTLNVEISDSTISTGPDKSTDT